MIVVETLKSRFHFLSLLVLIGVSAACGTEGGNPHRKDAIQDGHAVGGGSSSEGPVAKESPDFSSPGAGNREDFIPVEGAQGSVRPSETQEETDSSVSSGSSGLERLCRVTVTISQSGGTAGFSFEFSVPEESDTQTESGDAMTPNAALQIRPADSENGNSINPADQRPISNWDPAPGAWYLVVSLTDPNVVEPSRIYCSAAITLSAEVNAATNVKIQVQGLESE